MLMMIMKQSYFSFLFVVDRDFCFVSLIHIGGFKRESFFLFDEMKKFQVSHQMKFKQLNLSLIQFTFTNKQTHFVAFVLMTF